MKTYRARIGHDILGECRALVALAAATGEPHEMDFNDIMVTAEPASDPEALARQWHEESRQRREAYLASDEYKRKVAEAAAAEEKRRATHAAAMADAEARGVLSLTLRDRESWEKTAAVNKKDGYGAVIRYAETWGRLMEARVLAGQTVAECAEETSSIADTEGITGSMYGFAASMLCQWWVHGDALRAWRDSKGPCY